MFQYAALEMPTIIGWFVLPFQAFMLYGCFVILAALKDDDSEYGPYMACEPTRRTCRRARLTIAANIFSLISLAIAMMTNNHPLDTWVQIVNVFAFIGWAGPSILGNIPMLITASEVN